MGRKQMNATQRDAINGQREVRGWLVFWSIVEAERQVADLKAAAASAGLGQVTIDRITGRSSKSAWLNATQLGARGVNSRTFDFDAKGSTARYLVRDLKSESRALIREVINGEGERVDSYQVATFYHLNSGIEFALNQVAIEQAAQGVAADAVKLETEVRKVLSEMRATMSRMLGMVDDNKIRQILQTWLEDNHRICVRGTGGVYFVPRPSDANHAQAIEDEMIGLRSWVNGDAIKSTFSIVEIATGGATTVGDFTRSAIEEVAAEVAEINSKISGWETNPNMNDGSKMFSAQTMVDRADRILEKVQYLVDSLGEEMFVVAKLAEDAKKRALSMHQTSAVSVEASRVTKVAAKASAPEKKSGTAKERNAKQVVE